MSFHVIVQLKERTLFINGLKSTDTIADLVQKVVDKEGLDQDTMTLIFRAKQLSDTSKQLKDVGIKARSNLFAAFKVHGERNQDIENFIKLVCFLVKMFVAQ